MSQYSVDIFRNTGFNGDNVPDSINVVYNTPYLTEVFGYRRQGVSIAEITLELTASQAQEADYAVINMDGKKYCYFVTGFSMLAIRTCLLNIELDALTTMNVLASGSTAISGWMKRRIKSNSEMQDDELASKLVLDEPWTPTNEFVRDVDHGLVTGGTSVGTAILLSTVDLEALGESKEAKDYIVDGTANYVTVPITPVKSQTTYAKIDGADFSFNSNSVGYSYYRYNDPTIKEGFENALALGVTGGIVGSYHLPVAYGTAQGSPFINHVTSEVKYTTSSISADPGVSVENKKALYLHQTVELRSLISGEGQTYRLSKIGIGMEFMYWSDPTSQGCPYCRPVNIQNDTNSMYGAVAGGSWRNNPITLDNTPGYNVAEKQYNRSRFLGGVIPYKNTNGDGAFGQFLENSAAAVSAGTGATAATAGAATLLGISAPALLPLAAAAAAYGVSMSGSNKKKKEFQEQQNIFTPEIMFPAGSNMQNYIGNNFSVIRHRLSNADIARFDNFLHKYGESVDENFTNSKVHNRPSYDYVVLDDIMIKANFPNYIIEIAKNQLSGGIRVWHTTPNTGALEIGGNG